MIHRFTLWVLAAMMGFVLGVGPVKADEGTTQQPNQQPESKSYSCIQCHKVLGPKLGAPVEKLKNDIHAQKGLLCADCHGGDPTSTDISVAKSKEKGFVGAPKRAEIPKFCDKCHGNLTFMRRYNPSMPVGQFASYQTSVHGKRLAQGDTKVATCVNCHGAHGILPASQAASPVFPTRVAQTCAKCHGNKEYMKEYKIPTDQLQQYLQSVHAELLMVKRDLSAPTCNDCHGNHGAFPPSVQGIHDMCGQCHVNNNKFFTESPHIKAFDRQGLPECAVCHSNHKVLRTTDEMIGGKPPAICVGCHTSGSKGLQGAIEMRAQIEELKSAITQASDSLHAAERTGLEVSEASLSMKDARMALITARTKVHLFSPEEVKKEVAKGLKVAKAGSATAVAAMEEFGSRRVWVLLPIIFTIAVTGLLFAKLRKIEE